MIGIEGVFTPSEEVDIIDYPTDVIVTLVKLWFVERNLNNADPVMQLLKLGEELGELFEGVTKSKLDLIKDAIGDAIVVLIGYSLQRDISYNFTQEWSSTILPVHSHMFRLLAEVNSLYLTGKTYHVGYIMGDLTNIATHYGLTLHECLVHAYNEIKDRKGKLINGIFVKEDDLV